MGSVLAPALQRLAEIKGIINIQLIHSHCLSCMQRLKGVTEH